MKIIHTSDWHLGHSLYNYDRSEEQQAFLDQLRDIVACEQPDVLLVCGDIYHTTTPSSATQKMYTNGLLAIHKASPDTRIIITAGNHDSCAKLEIDRSLWQHFNVTVIGSIARNADRSTDWEQHILEITDHSGTAIGYIGAVPHVYPHNFPSQNGTLNREERQPAFFHELSARIEQRNKKRLPVILTAHLAVTGTDDTEEEMKVIGGMDTVTVNELGYGYDYLALGHIHYPHIVQKDYPTAAYCGSPLAVDFDEDYPHTITVVNIQQHGELPHLKTIEIRNPRPLTTFPQKASGLDEAIKALEQWPEEKKDYIRVNIKAEKGITPDIVERITRLLQGKQCRFCYVKIQKEESDRERKRNELSIEELKQKSPVEIAQMYYEEKEGETMEQELTQLMLQAWQETTRDQEEQENSSEPDKL